MLIADRVDAALQPGLCVNGLARRCDRALIAIESKKIPQHNPY
jgi:hypothetical protein